MYAFAITLNEFLAEERPVFGMTGLPLFAKPDVQDEVLQDLLKIVQDGTKSRDVFRPTFRSIVAMLKDIHIEARVQYNEQQARLAPVQQGLSLDALSLQSNSGSQKSVGVRFIDLNCTQVSGLLYENDLNHLVPYVQASQLSGTKYLLYVC